MRSFRAHIALGLLVLFGITMLPFNFLHHHAEDEHGMAMLQHSDKDGHHCELDEQFCQPGVIDDCDHEQHVSKTIAKCFSCEFHFIKHFNSNELNTEAFQLLTYKNFSAYQPHQLREALILLSNKGPPALV